MCAGEVKNRPAFVNHLASQAAEPGLKLYLRLTGQIPEPEPIDTCSSNEETIAESWKGSHL